jgi:hypothetical protein
MNINAINNYNYNRNLFVNNNRKAQIAPENQDTTGINQPTFKGKESSIGKLFSKLYAEPLMNNKGLQAFAEKLSKVPGSVTEHMATLGALITSSVYMSRTLNNKNLESDKRRTLAINQAFCFVVPTICAYAVNHAIAGNTKALEYRYSGRMRQQMALGKISPEKLPDLLQNFGKKLKGFKTLASLATFTLIYRYVTPVIITPIANKVGSKLNDRKVAKREAEQAQATKA